MKSAVVVLVGVLGMTGCATSGGSPRVVAPASAEQKSALLERMKSLDGEWTAKDPESGAMVTAAVFKTTSNGSAVREVMFPGSPHEMTNMYHMDGSSMVVTHYCAMGNQPQMRAKNAVGNAIIFEFNDVTNRTSEEQACMGEMTLEFVDADHIVERWRTIGTAASEATVIELVRKK
jgi:hypothetical protein